MNRLALALCLSTIALFSAVAQELTIESIYAPNGITGRAPDTVKWSPDGKKVSYIVHQESSGNAQGGGKADLYYIDVATGKPAVLVASDKIAAMAPPPSTGKDDRERDNRERYHVAGYHWSPDSQHILFDANGQLWYYTLSSGKAVPLTNPGEEASDPKFSGDGKHLSYVRKHNLVVRAIDGSPEKPLTSDTDENLLDGEVDWVYSEELDVRSNYFWSPDDRNIVFLQMNETRVPTYPIVDFIPQHPAVSQEKYPKVGDPNPEVRLGVVPVNGGNVRWISLGDSKDIYIPKFGWVNSYVCWAMVLNRAQNQLDLYFIDAASGKSRRVLSEKDDAWIEVNDFHMFKSADRFIWMSWRDGHTHAYLYSFDKNNPLAADAKLQNQITKGDFESFDIEGVDENAGVLYIITNVGDPRQRHLCSVKLDGSNFQVITKAQPGTHQAAVSPNGQFFVNNYSATMTPPEMSFCRISGTCDVFWKSNSLESYNLIAPHMLELKADDGTILYGELFLPPNSEGKKIPLLNNPYGGPHGQSVRNMWGGATFLFNQILMRDGIAVLVVDNRGMGARGRAFAKTLMHNFGEVELKDQLSAIDQVLRKFPQLDGSRLGWWGWSYGGYMTLTAMTHSDRFKAGVSVAPVTDWRDYDSIYTERYAGLVPENDAAYKKSSPINYAAQLHGHLLEVHGTSDDNVHMQNTMQMIAAFINSGKQFDLQLYPRKTHSISGQAARVHLFNRIRNHFRQELLGQEQPQEHRASGTGQ